MEHNIESIFKDSGNRLKEIRRELNLSQQDVCIEAEISRSYLSDFENGYRRPTAKYLEYLHDRYDVNLNYIFHGENSMFRKGTSNCPPDFGDNQGDVNKLLCLMHAHPYARHMLLAFGEKLKMRVS